MNKTSVQVSTVQKLPVSLQSSSAFLLLARSIHDGGTRLNHDLQYVEGGEGGGGGGEGSFLSPYSSPTISHCFFLLLPYLVWFLFGFPPDLHGQLVLVTYLRQTFCLGPRDPKTIDRVEIS